jgi:hypothetical protein
MRSPYSAAISHHHTKLLPTSCSSRPCEVPDLRQTAVQVIMYSVAQPEIIHQSREDRPTRADQLLDEGMTSDMMTMTMSQSPLYPTTRTPPDMHVHIETSSLCHDSEYSLSSSHYVRWHIFVTRMNHFTEAWHEKTHKDTVFSCHGMANC